MGLGAYTRVLLINILVSKNGRVQMLIWLHAASGLEVHTVTSMTAQKKIETFVQLEISFRKKGVIKTAKTFNLVCLLHQQCVI